MKKILFILFTLMVAAPQFVGAQDKNKCPYDFNKMDSLEHKRAIFLTEELQLTEKEKEAFMPIVDQFIKDRFELFVAHNKVVTTLRKKEAKTASDYNTMIDDHLSSETKKLDLEKKFYTDMRKVLPADKAYRYKRAESKFMHKLMDGKRKNRSGKARESH